MSVATGCPLTTVPAIPRLLQPIVVRAVYARRPLSVCPSPERCTVVYRTGDDGAEHLRNEPNRIRNADMPLSVLAESLITAYRCMAESSGRREQPVYW